MWWLWCGGVVPKEEPTKLNTIFVVALPREFFVPPRSRNSYFDGGEGDTIPTIVGIVDGEDGVKQ